MSFTIQTAIKRILSDIQQLKETPIDGLEYYVDEDNIFKIKALIVGPQSTPYENGFYFFDIKIPNDYPLNPPELKFCTLDPSVRFNPNLYTNGKVCLSIINTWEGPSWTPCNTIGSILISLLSFVFNNYPLRNEPGHENDSVESINEYNAMINHESFRVATIRMLHYPPNGFEVFNNYIRDYFQKNFNQYMERAHRLKETEDKKHFYCNTYNMGVHTNYEKIMTDLQETYQLFHPTKMDIEVSLNMKLKELQEIAEKNGISSQKVGKSGKNINKTKSELVEEIENKT